MVTCNKSNNLLYPDTNQHIQMSMLTSSSSSVPQMINSYSVPLLSAGIGVAGSAILFGMDSVDLGPISLPAPVLYGLILGGSSLIASLTKESAYRLIGLDEFSVSLTARAVTPLITGLSTAGLAFVINGMELPGSTMDFLLKTIAFGALTQVSAQYISDSVFNKNTPVISKLGL